MYYIVQVLAKHIEHESPRHNCSMDDNSYGTLEDYNIERVHKDHKGLLA